MHCQERGQEEEGEEAEAEGDEEYELKFDWQENDCNSGYIHHAAFYLYQPLPDFYSWQHRFGGTGAGGYPKSVRVPVLVGVLCE